MAAVAPPGALQRARTALRGPDFRKLFAIRIVGQGGDGFFTVALFASVVFNPNEHSTTLGLFKAGLITALPFTLLGPFVGVFIDRWQRRHILAYAPLLKVALVGLVLFDPTTHAVPFYVAALAVISVNRFYLATASAVVPRLVPSDDLLIANSLATVGGTLALLVGFFIGGQLADAGGSGPVVAVAAGAWLAATWIAIRLRSDLAPKTIPEPEELLRHRLRRVIVEFTDGARTLIRTPRAIGPITTISIDSMGQGIILTVAAVVFREQFIEGVGSYSNLVGAGGVGVLTGIVTVGWLEERWSKERIIAGAFVVGGLALLGAALYLRGWSILVASFVVGLAFAWKKVPVDTIVQGSLPDGYRGRVFSVYDVVYNVARILAAALVIPLVPALGTHGTVALVSLVFIAWAPALPRWIGGTADVRIVFSEGARAEEWPRAVRWGAAEESVEVLKGWLEERNQELRRCFRLSLRDGTVLDVSRPEPDGVWTIDRERDEPRTLP
jgi:predicted MFS family arabinose efflux permease